MFQGVLFSTLPNQMLTLFVYTFLPILTAGPYPQGIEETIEMCIYVNVELVFKGWRSLNNIFEYEINKQKKVIVSKTGTFITVTLHCSDYLSSICMYVYVKLRLVSLIYKQTNFSNIKRSIKQ